MAAKKKVQQQSREDRLRALLQKKFGKYAALSVGGEAKAQAAAQIQGYCSTGIDVLDRYVIGSGGMPEGRLSEIFGEEGCGKTSLGYSALAANQRAGGVSCVSDAEFSFDEERAEMFGVDLERLIILQPKNLEEHFEIVKTTLKEHDGKAPLLIVHDSIAATQTKTGQSAEAGDSKVGEIPRMYSQELPKLLDMSHKKRAHLMMLNQIRAKIGVMFGSNTTTPGGNAPKFYTSVRLQFFGGKGIKNKVGEHTGKVVTIMAVKNRLSPPWHKARVRLDYATGWNNEWTTIQHAIKMKLISPRGSNGKKKSGHKAYLEACEALGWPYQEGDHGTERIVRPSASGDIEVSFD